MRGIHDYSVKELKKLHGEFKKLKTYEDKVNFVYSRFGKVYGHINQEVGGLDFTIKPKDGEENKVRWMYFFNARKEEVLQKLMADYRDRYEKAPDDAVFIEASLLEVRKIYESNSNLKYGYEMGSLAKGLDWIHWDQVNMDWTEILWPYYEGWAYYRLEQWLKGLKEEASFDDEWIRSKEMPGVPLLVALIQETGLIEHLSKKYPRLNNHKTNLAKLLSELCQVEDKHRMNFLKTLTNAINGSSKWKPDLEAVSAILLKAGAIDPPIQSNPSRKRNR